MASSLDPAHSRENSSPKCCEVRKASTTEGPEHRVTLGFDLWTVGFHVHSLGLQGSHVRATHVRGLEIDPVTCSEPCVVQQRLDVGEAWVAVEPVVFPRFRGHF